MTCLGCAPCLRNSNFRVRVYTAILLTTRRGSTKDSTSQLYCYACLYPLSWKYPRGARWLLKYLSHTTVPKRAYKVYAQSRLRN
jgi:hypothetical protein